MVKVEIETPKNNRALLGSSLSALHTIFFKLLLRFAEKINIFHSLFLFPIVGFFQLIIFLVAVQQ